MTPRAEYTARLHERQTRAARLAQRERSIAHTRLLVFAAAVVIAWLAFGSRVISPGWLGVPAVIFLGLVIHHDRVIKERRRAERSVAFYAAGLARIDDTWAGSGESGERFLTAPHVYAADLDLFGAGSLFQLLCTVRTRGGEDTLARWLLAPAASADILARHAAVVELRPRVDLREEIALLGEDVRVGVRPDALAAWGAAPPILFSPPLRRAAVCFTALTLATFVVSLTAVGSLPLTLALVAQGLFGWRLRARVLHVTHAITQPSEDLSLLAQLLERVEREPMQAPRLLALRQRLSTLGVPPSQHVARLRRLVHLLDARKNQFFAPLAPLLLWGTHCAFAIEAWRAAVGPALSEWLTAIAEIEALTALGAYSFEHPDDPFPEILEDGPVFDGAQLGHPLLPLQQSVRNDVRLDRALAVLIVSGSNMSGKSTLLRTVGTNAVLALAGAPIRAHRLRISPLAVGASIRVQDSLQAGASRFYAEITRLRQLVDIAQASLPLLFLLDEILHGTNSHDRRIGAEAVVRSLAELGAVGLVTTHDLALAHIAESLAPRATNVHFADHLENGRMVFDYRLHPGVVEKSNALELMRAVGLKV
jgi:hypothetical protein